MKAIVAKYWQVLLLTTTQLLYVLPYLDQTFYVQFRAEFGLTNEQSGGLIGYYSMATLPAYLFGGWLADRFSGKRLLVLSCLIGGGLGVMMSRAADYDALAVLYLVFGLTTSALNWSAYFKLIRALGTDTEQGRLFTFSDAVVAVLSAIVQYGTLWLMVDAGMSLRRGIACISVAIVLFGVVVLLLCREPPAAAFHAAREQPSGVALIAALRHPATWIMGLMWLFAYVATTTLTYANPYLSQVLGVSAGIATAMEVFRYTLLKIGLSPAGGWWRDRLGRSPPLFFTVFGSVAVLASVLSFAAGHAPPVWLVIALVAAIATLMTLMIGSLYAMMAEARVPIAITGTVWGVVSIVGYSSDLWLPRLAGRWIDQHGVAGYQRAFAVVAVSALLGLISTWIYRAYLAGRLFAQHRAAAAVPDLSDAET